MSQAHKDTQLSNKIKIQPQNFWAHCVILAYHDIRFSISKTTFHSMFIIVNHGDRHSFCPNSSKAHSYAPVYHQIHRFVVVVVVVVVVSVFVLDQEITMDIV